MKQDLPLFDVDQIPEDLAEAEVRIHPTAVVEAGAQLGRGVVVGPYSVVGAQVELHDGVRIGSHTTIEGRTRVGARTVVHNFCSLGVAPQDLKYGGEATELVIGEENSLRQYCNLSVGTEGGGGRTVVGRRNLLMVNTHVAHDCQVGDNCVFANGVSLGGHVWVDSAAVIGGHAAVHQFCRIGGLTMIAGGAMVVQDVPPFCMVQGDRASISGLNVVGLRRTGIRGADLQAVKTMYKLLYKENLTIEQCLARIESEIPDSPYRQAYINFLQKSERGVCR